MFHNSLVGDNLHIARIANGVGSPISVVVPSIVGEAYFDLVDKKLYIAHGLTNADWSLTSGGGGSGTSDHSELTNRDIAGNHAKLIPSVDSSTAIQLTKANGTDSVLTIDTLNNKLITLSDYIPSSNYHLVTKKYVDESIQPNPTSIVRTVYVSSTGSNSNIGDETHPWLTLDYALQNAPNFGNYSINIYSGEFVMGKIYDIIGDKSPTINIKSFSNTDVWNIIESGTMSINTYFKHTDSSKTWSINQHRGRFLKDTITNNLYVIAYNSENILYVNGGESFAIENITTYDILDHSVKISTTEAIIINNYSLILSKLKMTTTNISGISDRIDGRSLYADNCSIIANQYILRSRPNLYALSINKSYIEHLSNNFTSVLPKVNASGLVSDRGFACSCVASSCVIPRTSGKKNTSAIGFNRLLAKDNNTLMDMYDNFYKDYVYAVSSVSEVSMSPTNFNIILSDRFEYENVDFAFYCVNGVFINGDKTYPVYDLGIPNIGQLTTDGVTESSYYYSLENNINALFIAPDNMKRIVFNPKYNLDVDTGTEIVDSFPDSLCKSCRWDYVIDDGTNMRAGQITALWKGAEIRFSDMSTTSIGDTSGVSFSVTKNVSTIELNFTVSSNNWKIETQRYPIGWK